MSYLGDVPSNLDWLVGACALILFSMISYFVFFGLVALIRACGFNGGGDRH